MLTVGAVIMMGGHAPTSIEKRLQALQQAAARDLIECLHAYGVAPIIVCTPDIKWLDKTVTLPHVVPYIDFKEEPFHFGTQLAQVIDDYQFEAMAYFGGASAPLLTSGVLDTLFELLDQSESIVITNNIHSSDWIATNRPSLTIPIIKNSQRDNSLAWELRESGQFKTVALSNKFPVLNFDLDTPSDFAIVHHHTTCPNYLTQAIRNERLLDNVPVADIVDIFRRNGSQVGMVGRVSPHAWQAINAVTRCWIRVYAEERGMVASGREARGEVQSLLGMLMDVIGAEKFFGKMASMCDALIIDSRVLMAHHGLTPPADQRFLSDLLQADTLADGWLREFTTAARDCGIPVLLGGHSVVSGGLFVLSEILRHSD